MYTSMQDVIVCDESRQGKQSREDERRERKGEKNRIKKKRG
jgi:hypothetical protein